MSGEAEAEFDKGYRINLDGTRHLIDAIRAVGGGYKPRLVFTSSIAVFGAPFPEKIGDEFFHTPLTSYGTQKSICELLINDYTRKGLLDGISIRLPTICVRPGKPNKAASGFFSNIMREPLAGEEAVLPVSDDVRHWHASPKSAVGFLLHAGTMDLNVMGARRNLSMPGLSATVGEQIAALDRVAGKNVTARIKRVPDPTIIVHPSVINTMGMAFAVAGVTMLVMLAAVGAALVNAQAEREVERELRRHNEMLQQRDQRRTRSWRTSTPCSSSTKSSCRPRTCSWMPPSTTWCRVWPCSIRSIGSWSPMLATPRCMVWRLRR